MSQMLQEKLAFNMGGVTNKLGGLKDTIGKTVSNIGQKMYDKGGVYKAVSEMGSDATKATNAKTLVGTVFQGAKLGGHLIQGVGKGVHKALKTAPGRAVAKIGGGLGAAALIGQATQNAAQQQQQKIMNTYASSLDSSLLEKRAMKLNDVDSTCLRSVGYSPMRRQMELEFLHGGAYRYRGIPQSVYSELRNAESLGKYFQKNISGKYEYKKQRDAKGKHLFGEHWKTPRNLRES